MADEAVIEAERVAAISLSAVKDNPTFLPATANARFGIAVSSGGYQDQFANRAMDGVNASFADLCTLAARQAARLVSGTELDSGGNQSDIAHTALIAYDRHQEAASALDECLGALAMASALALTARNAEPPAALTKLWATVSQCWDYGAPSMHISGEPLRAIIERFNELASGPRQRDCETE